MEKTILTVTGMSCSHCENAVVNALKEIPGVKSAKASAKKNTVAVEYDSQMVSIDTIKAEIIDVGYDIA